AFINICNDPWGNAYEWDNVCAGGGTRKPHAPYDPSCTSFSATSQGAIGVTLVGSNGINDGCTGDDICTGTNGHSEYGWTETPSGPSCTATITSCSSLSTGVCASRQGCSLTSSSCSGSYSSSCAPLSNQTNCQSQSGCSWIVTPSCTGTYSCSQWN